MHLRRCTASFVALALSACGTGAPDGPDDPSVEDGSRDPGRVALRRLNRSEYDRTVRDLLGTSRQPARTFPVDDASHGFDNVAEGLAVSPLLVELYEQAAGQLVAEVLDVPLREAVDLPFEAESEHFTTDAQYQGRTATALRLSSPGTVTGDVDIRADGTYRLSALVYGDQAGPDPVVVRLGFVAEGNDTFDVTGDGPDEAAWISVDVELREGRHVIELIWANDFYDPPEDRNAYVDAFRVEGPLDFEGEQNPAYDAVMVCELGSASDPRACVSDVLEALAPKAWRRPVSQEELDGLLSIYDGVLANGDPPTWGLEYALRAVLTSPHFVFHVEPAAEGGLVDDHALASRLSYLIWSSMPDDELRTLADQGVLNDPAIISAQVERMLDDPRAEALADDLAGQWLMIRAIDDASPDFFTFLAFHERVRTSMKTSMSLFFQDFVFDDLPLTDLLVSTDAWVDEQLAPIYGLPGSRDFDGFERVDVGSYSRRGWLTTPGLLMATSYPDRTSPVRRGVWVLSNLLCDEPPPPPAGVEGLPEADEELLTVRDRLAAHRQNPQCAGCHNAIDPIGLGFEHFDGIGMWRGVDQGVDIDASGELPDGTTFDGVVELADILAADARFSSCVVEKLFTYAHGRAPAASDEPYLADILKGYRDGGETLQALLTAVATSDTFRSHGEAP